MKIFILLFILLNTKSVLSCDNENSYSVVKALFLNYEDTEYEDVLIQCETERIWSIKDSKYLKELHSLYKTSKLSEYGELYVEISGVFTEIDSSKYPNNHSSGVFDIKSIIKTSGETKIIEGCRKPDET